MPAILRYKPPRRYPDCDAVLAEIRLRAKAGLPLSTVSTVEGKHRDKRLVVCAREYFHTWRHAVEAAIEAADTVRPEKGGE